MRFGQFCAEKCKNHFVFQRKTISAKPKAIRNQVGGHWDPLRNHKAEAEEEREKREEGEERGREGTEGRERRREEREEREEGGCSVVCCSVVVC